MLRDGIGYEEFSAAGRSRPVRGVTKGERESLSLWRREGTASHLEMGSWDEPIRFQVAGRDPVHE